MDIKVTLTKAQAEAVLRAELSLGHGVHRSQALEEAQIRLREAILKAQGKK